MADKAHLTTTIDRAVVRQFTAEALRVKQEAYDARKAKWLEEKAAELRIVKRRWFRKPIMAPIGAERAAELFEAGLARQWYWEESDPRNIADRLHRMARAEVDGVMTLPWNEYAVLTFGMPDHVLAKAQSNAE